jgi:hypothetical protein
MLLGDGDSAWLRERSRTATTPVSPKRSLEARRTDREGDRAERGRRALQTLRSERDDHIGLPIASPVSSLFWPIPLGDNRDHDTRGTRQDAACRWQIAAGDAATSSDRPPPDHGRRSSLGRASAYSPLRGPSRRRSSSEPDASYHRVDEELGCH